MKRKHSITRWPFGVALILVLGALVLAGCGGSSGSSSSSESSTTASAAPAEGGAESSGSESSGAAGEKGGPGNVNISEEAKACLKEKGVELPEFKGGEGGPPSAGSGEAPQGAEGGELPQGGEGGPPAGGGFGGEGSEEPEVMKKAFEECGVEAPGFKAGAGGAGGPNMNSAAFKRQVKKYVACVRENGYDLPEPNLSGEGPVFEKSESESAAFKKASAKCQSLLGGPGGSGSKGESET